MILYQPTEGIQPGIIKDIGRVIRMLADRGDMTILPVEQYYDFAEELADDYLVWSAVSSLPAGKAMKCGPIACVNLWLLSIFSDLHCTARRAAKKKPPRWSWRL